MKFLSKRFVVGILVVGVVIGGAIFAKQKSPLSPFHKKQMILIGVDGMQYEHFKNSLNAGKLPNFEKIIGEDGYFGSILITGHEKTETAPGNAEILTGLNEKITGVSENTCEIEIPKGLTVFERLKSFDKNIEIGSIYGKGTCYIPNAILKNAKASIDWWQDRNSYKQNTYISENCADSIDVAKKSLEFLKTEKDNSYFLLVYFGALDCAGHRYGENSKEYDAALENIDEALGVISDWTSSYEINIVLTADHGWNKGVDGHGLGDIYTKTLPFISNDSSLATKEDGEKIGKQCNIVPIIYKYFGLPKPIFSDVINNGCGI